METIVYSILIEVVIFACVFLIYGTTAVVAEEFSMEGVVTDVDYATGAGTIIQIGNSERFTLSGGFNTDILIGHRYRFYEMRSSLFKMWKGYHIEEVE